MITLAILKALFPATPTSTLEPYVELLNSKLPAYDVVGAKRVAAFLAQVGHESGGFKTREENLNYSAERLLVVFKKYFNATSAARYARKPEAIASRVYANRYGNGNEASGDGWRFRGRGLMQVTFRANYEAFTKWANMPLTDVPDYLSTIEGSVMSAIWYWTSRGLNELADGDQITAITKKVNGGETGLEERKAIWRKAVKLLS